MIDPVDPLPRRQVGVEIATAKAVDRLFGIPHQQQQMLGAVRKGPAQQAPLHGVGVLKFIHHHRPIALLQRCQPGGIGLTRIQSRQQATEGDHPTATPPRRQLSQSFLQQIKPDPFNRSIPERSHRLLQGGGNEARFRFTALARHAAPATGVEVLLQRLLDRRDRLQGRPRILLLNPLLQLGAAIGAGFGAVGGTGLDPAGFPLLRRRAEAGLQVGVIALPERQKRVPGGGDPTLQLRSEGLIDRHGISWTLQLGLDVAIQLSQAAAQAVRRQAPLTQATQFRHGQRQQLLLPEVLHHLRLQRRSIGLQLRLHGSAAVQRQSAQAAATEAVDRGDIGAIQLLEGHQQTTDPQAPLGGIDHGCTPVRQHRIRHGQSRPLLRVGTIQLFQTR